MTRLTLLALAACGAALAPGAGPPPAPRPDRHGDPLPAGALARLGTLHFRPEWPPHFAAISPDRRWLATSDEKRVDLWDVRTGRVVRRIDAPPNARPSLPQFTPDGRSLVVVSHGRPDERSDALLADGFIELYPVPAGRRRYRRKVPRLLGTPLVAGGKWLLGREARDAQAAAADTVLWSLADGTEKRRVKGATAAACSPDGKLLATGAPRGAIRLAKVESGEEVRTLAGPAGEVTWLLFAADGRKLASLTRVAGLFGDYNLLRTWGVEKGDARARYRLPTAVSLVTDDLRWAVHHDRGRSVLLNVARGESHPLPAGGTFNEEATLDSRWLAFTDGRREVQLWRLDGERPRRAWSRPADANAHLAFSADGKALLVKGPGVRLFDLAAGKDAFARPAHLAAINWAYFLNDGRSLLSRDDSGELRMWRWAEGQAVPLSADGSLREPTVVPSPDEKRLATVSADRELRVWSLKSGRPLAARAKLPPVLRLSGGRPYVFADEPSPDGRLLATFDDKGAVSVWDLQAAKRLDRPNLPKSGAQQARFAPDGRHLAWTTAGEAVFWRVSDGKVVHHQRGSGSGITFSEDGRLAACRGADRVWVHDLDKGRPVAELKARDAPGTSQLAFLGGRYLAVVTQEETEGEPPRGWYELYDLPSRALLRSEEEASILLEPSTYTALLMSRAARGAAFKEVRDGLTGRVVVEKVDALAEQLTPTRDGRFVIVSSRADGPLRVFERATGGELARLERTGHRGGVTMVTLSPDGRHLATGGHDTTILVRDFRALCGLGRPGEMKLDEGALESRWRDLAAADAKVGWRAVADLAACPGATAFLAGRLRPVGEKEAAAVRGNIEKLDDDSFAVRRKARKELDALGAEWLTELHDGLGGATVEVTRALQVLLRSPKRRAYSAEGVRRLRAVAVLEWQATSEAKRLLRRLASGADGVELTQQAKAALGRLGR